MINWFQKMLYRLALITPIVIIAVILHSIQVHRISLKAWIVLAVASILAIYHLVFIFWLSKKLPEIPFTSEVAPQEDDKTLVEIAVTYIIPFIGWGIGYMPVVNIPSYLIPGIGCLVILIILTVMNNTIASPLYWLCGFHFHIVEVDGKGYRIVSRKKNYRNSKKIKAVKRLFDDLLLIV
jgi:hypothetical protein